MNTRHSLQDMYLHDGDTFLYASPFWHEGVLAIAPDLGVMPGKRTCSVKEWREVCMEELEFQIRTHQVCGSPGHFKRAMRLIRNAAVHLKRKHGEEQIKVFLCASDERRYEAYKWLAKRAGFEIRFNEEDGHITILL